MKKTIIILITLCLLLCSCNAANAKTLASVASSATTLTQELDEVYNSGGTVTKDQLFNLKTAEITKHTEVYWYPGSHVELVSPWSEEGLKTNHPIDTNKYFEIGCVYAVKYNVIDDGVEYVVYCAYNETASTEVLTVFRAENTATGEVFYDDSIFEDAEITPVQPETEIE